MTGEMTTLESPTGASLALRHWPVPEKSPRAMLMVSHGMSEHSGRYGALAAAMNAAGFAVLANDHRGHGYTTAQDAPPMRFAWRGGAEKVVADVLCIRDHAETLYPGMPVFLLGHSMGGLIALNAALEAPHRFAGVAPWNMDAMAPAPMIAAARLVLKTERALKGSDVPSLALPALTVEMWNRNIPGMKTEADWLSHDRTVIDAFLADPLCGRPATVSMWLDIFDFIGGWRARPLSDAARALPFFLLGGAEDPSTGHGKALQRLAAHLEKRGFTSLKTAIYPKSRHETLLDDERDRATAELIAWCDACLSKME